MTHSLITANHRFIHSSTTPNFFSKSPKRPSLSIPVIPLFSTICCSSLDSSQYDVVSQSNKAFNQSNLNSKEYENSVELQRDGNVQVGIVTAAAPPYVPTAEFSLSNRAFILIAFVACSTSIAFASFVIASVSALHAMARAAVSLSKLADTACEELPGTMAAVRLSGMEISDLTLELSDLSQEIADGVNKSAEVVQVAEAGIRQIGTFAHHQTISMIEERANLPVISIKPVVTGAAKKTYQAVGQATRAVLNILSRGVEHVIDRSD